MSSSGLHVHVCMCIGGVNDFYCLAVYNHSLALSLSLSFQEEAPLYRSLEKKIESMTECSQIQHDIKKTIDDPSPLYGRGFRDLHTHLELLRDEYMNKSSKWSEILNTNGR